MSPYNLNLKLSYHVTNKFGLTGWVSMQLIFDLCPVRDNRICIVVLFKNSNIIKSKSLIKKIQINDHNVKIIGNSNEFQPITGKCHRSHNFSMWVQLNRLFVIFIRHIVNKNVPLIIPNSQKFFVFALS